MAGHAQGTQRRARRTQEERRAATRGALLDATVDCLIEYGYAGVTTTKVVERAGVSRGAQVHHFPTKAQLVAEALAHLADRRAQEMLGELERLPRGAKRLQGVLDALWHSHSGPLFQAALELWVAARTDAELREHLVGVERDIVTAVASNAASLFPEEMMDRDFPATMETALATMRGMALLGFLADEDDAAVERRWRAVRKRLLWMFEHGRG